MSPLGSHVPTVILPNEQYDAPDASYPDAHVGWQDAPCASDDVQFPTWPLRGAVDALHPFALISQVGLVGAVAGEVLWRVVVHSVQLRMANGCPKMSEWSGESVWR